MPRPSVVAAVADAVAAVKAAADKRAVEAVVAVKLADVPAEAAVAVGLEVVVMQVVAEPEVVSAAALVGLEVVLARLAAINQPVAIGMSVVVAGSGAVAKQAVVVAALTCPRWQVA
jgi:hypothetical protein